LNTIHAIVEAGEDGKAHVDLAVGVARRIEVTIAWRELEPPQHVDAASQQRKRIELESLAGVLADDPLERPEQPRVEARLPVE